MEKWILGYALTVLAGVLITEQVRHFYQIQCARYHSRAAALMAREAHLVIMSCRVIGTVSTDLEHRMDLLSQTHTLLIDRGPHLGSGILACRRARDDLRSLYWKIQQKLDYPEYDEMES